MFNKKTTEERPGLNEAIDIVVAELKKQDPNTESYSNVLTQLERLHKLVPAKAENTVSKDNLISVIGSLCGIGMIIGYEQFHVIGSKALPFVIKSKV